MIDLGPRSRVVFAVLWIGGQVVLIATSKGRVDGAFGFRGDVETGTLSVRLVREVNGARAEVVGGEWSARDASGELHKLAWSDRVKDPRLAIGAHVSTNVEADLARLRRALDDVAAHVEGDSETRSFELHVTFTVNDSEPTSATLRSKPRW